MVRVPLPINIKKWFKDAYLSIPSLYAKKFKNTCSTKLEKTLSELLITNFTIWTYEDNVRRKDLPDTEIANFKRKIDIENQKRNNLMDTIDVILKNDIEKFVKKPTGSLPLNSETPGSIFDRLTVLCLREYHLEKETQRKDVEKSHIERCEKMLKEVRERSNDLLKCLEELLTDYYNGKKRLKAYCQHKLYNDPALNPALRKQP